MNKIFLKKICSIFQNDIIPITTKGVSLGNKIFGAAIIRKKDYKIIVAGTNNEVNNPLWHGEIDTIIRFYNISSKKRPSVKDCYFISSHEPCSLCLSAITWCGFNNFYYLFSYKDTKEKYKIPHDLKILKEVFNIHNGKYITKNYYWNSYNINKLISKLAEDEKFKILIKLAKIKESYKKLSNEYQLKKNKNKIILK